MTVSQQSISLVSITTRTTAPQSTECCIVDVMRVVRIIPISDLDKNTFMYWAKRFINYLNLLQVM